GFVISAAAKFHGQLLRSRQIADTNRAGRGKQHRCIGVRACSQFGFDEPGVLDVIEGENRQRGGQEQRCNGQKGLSGRVEEKTNRGGLLWYLNLYCHVSTIIARRWSGALSAVREQINGEGSEPVRAFVMLASYGCQTRVGVLFGGFLE